MRSHKLGRYSIETKICVVLFIFRGIFLYPYFFLVIISKWLMKLACSILLENIFLLLIIILDSRSLCWCSAARLTQNLPVKVLGWLVSAEGALSGSFLSDSKTIELGSDPSSICRRFIKLPFLLHSGFKSWVVVYVRFLFLF